MAFRFGPRQITGQMMAVLGMSFLLLLGTMAALEFFEYDNILDTADSDFTSQRLQRIIPVLRSIPADQIPAYLARVSHCHDGYTVSETAYAPLQTNDQTTEIAGKFAVRLSVEPEIVRLGFATLHRDDFSYQNCAPSEMQFPLQGMVVSLRIGASSWLNAEIHPHEWHVTPDMEDWLMRSLAAFLVIGGIALLFVHRLSQPFKALANAANSFASELEITELDETGPGDVKLAIRSFNLMQRQVTDEMERRASTLAAISHDIRTPLTALRVKTELIDDERLREDHISSIEKMERITASALDYLKGESRNEPMRKIDLGELVDSACAEFQELGADVHFECPSRINYACRPDALTRAINNLIENAVKYAGSANVSITCVEQQLEIAVADSGPGIPSDKVDTVLEPFERLCQARDSETGGFGLGLAIANAVAKGHDGTLTLTANSPTGLIATLKLPFV